MSSIRISDLDFEKETTHSPQVVLDISALSGNSIKDINPLVKYHAINLYYSVDGRNMEKLLNDLNIVTRGTNMFCPFHFDELTGKPSAKYHPESDSMYCFSEAKVYTSYHALKFLYGSDMDDIFMHVWERLSPEDKHNLVGKYEDESKKQKNQSSFVNPVWLQHRDVLTQFRQGNVNIKQHRNALYKILKMINSSDIPVYQ